MNGASGFGWRQGDSAFPVGRADAGNGVATDGWHERTVLVVDDEALICAQLGEILEAAGYRLAGTAASAEQAVARARALAPDLVLMDIVMPGETDGLDACRIIQEEMGIPVILVTAHGFEANQDRVRGVAPYGYVLKPYSDEQILAAVEVALSRRRTECASSRALGLRVRETHHRAKNSFMLAHSLLRLRQEEAGSEEARRSLGEAAGQVYSLAKIHEHLHGLGEDESVDCRSYLEGLVAALRKAFGPAAQRVRVELDAADLRLPAAQAIPCGLVLNELLTNVFKHAFPGGGGGTVWVGLRAGGETIRLEVRDDGVGFAPAERARHEGLGMELISALAEQLGGWFRRTESEGGAACLLEFPRQP
ncbi:response regulator [Desulfovibrio aminophilus]|nr:response regulator [Desulfovibrio aminophilus]MCM0754940.1 response regulator [Desulfovibrio aminophilus]